ncbi:hypothetical protein [Flavobacterium sp.]|uniref:hypothetical protein n=1 Tax=Flavobacterium sp. TaxID=239 RepID=UPI003D0B1EA5
MNSKSVYIYLILFFTLISCNQKSAKDSISKDNFSIIVEGVFAKNDNLQVFYLTNDKDWNDENSIVVPVYASLQMQKLKIDLPEKIIPKNIRVDVGENEYQSNITLKNISVLYKNDTIDGDNDNFKLLFYPNEFISWDPVYFGYKLSKINNSYDPYFMGNDLLIDKLDIIKDHTKEE